MSATATPVNELLQQLADSLDALAALQQQELKAIVERQHSSVADIAQQKAQQLEQVSSLDATLREHPDANLLKDDDALAAQVTEIKRQLADVQQQSAVNERVVQSTLNSIEQLKQAILSNAKKDSLTYNAKGKIR
ncbi:flagella synthesis protein FlgN [Idiomarina aquatica]|uniref:Flagella synthesis protein FlgN n=1 Tax=Idiomarina aquatica TaxID=1327752 RepID=A0A4R6PPN0_9GAMM|nr:flagellar export chaperone FlgN [Idiomarina aquatica]TDP40325.1 flagella synthesis protein FlgN [Idiomarina aquatica]